MLANLLPLVLVLQLEGIEVAEVNAVCLLRGCPDGMRHERAEPILVEQLDPTNIFCVAIDEGWEGAVRMKALISIPI